MNIITRKQVEVKYKDDIKNLKKDGYSKSFIKQFVNRMMTKEVTEMKQQARATQHFITTDPKTGKQYNSMRVMNRKIARNMARKQVGGNKGVGDVFREIFLPTRNNDKKHIQMKKDMAYNQKREARLLKMKEGK